MDNNDNQNLPDQPLEAEDLEEWFSEEESAQSQHVPQQMAVQEEESKLDPSWKMKDQITHCPHYFRFCEKKAPCCQIFYPCRLCHDENYKGPKAVGCKVEMMKRQEVSTIRCKRCLVEQAPSKECVTCNITFGLYFCPVCKFWDDDPKKIGDIYHCDKCNMCRRGSPVTNFHCDSCGVCMSKTIEKTHKCSSSAMDSNCPVCMENMHHSVKGSFQIGLCKHWMHAHCFYQYIKNSDRCPVCNTALYKMSPQQIAQIDTFVEQTKENLPEEIKNKKTSIQCLECHKESKEVNFHVYMKCLNCGSYNTKE